MPYKLVCRITILINYDKPLKYDDILLKYTPINCDIFMRKWIILLYFKKYQRMLRIFYKVYEEFAFYFVYDINIYLLLFFDKDHNVNFTFCILKHDFIIFFRMFSIFIIDIKLISPSIKLIA